MTRCPRAFSLLEVIIALGLFALGATAVIALYNNNLRTARQTKEELTLALMARELRARSQLAALTAFDGARSTFEKSDWLPRDGAASDDAGEPLWLDGGGGGGSSDAEALNGQSWTAIRQQFDALGLGNWDDEPLYANWQFRLRTVWPEEIECNQFVDWDGYDWYDRQTRSLQPNVFWADAEPGPDMASQREQPLQIPAKNRGAPPAGAQDGGGLGPPRPSHGVSFEPRGLRYHLKRLKCVIGWDLRSGCDIFSGQNQTFFFTIYNPDLRR